jgi:predicted RNase H-like HicB family nuclease
MPKQFRFRQPSRYNSSTVNDRGKDNVFVMQYQVFVQSFPNNGFVAAVIGMPDCLAEGQTKEEAVANAKRALQSRLSEGEIVTIDVDPSPGLEDNPLLKHFGRFKDDPTFDDYLADIEAYRRQVDEEEAAK